MKRIFSSLILALTLSLALAANTFAAEFPKVDPEEYAGKKIGVTTGSVQERWAKDDFKDSKLVYVTNIADGALALETGVIDALYSSDLPIRFFIGENPNKTMLRVREEGVPVAPIFAQNEEGDKLRAQFNEYIAKVEKDGTLKRLEDKWIDGPEEIREFEDPSTPPAVNGKLNIITMSGTPPFNYVKNRQITGFEIEVVREFCREIGYEPVFVDASLDGVIMGVHTGKYAMGASALMFTEERAKSVNFSNQICECKGALLVNKDIATEKQGFFTSISEGFKRTFIEEDRWKMFASGIWATFLITTLSVLFGTALGFLLYLLCRNGNKIANTIVNAVNWLVTGMPLVVFLMVLFYIVFVKTDMSSMTVAIIGCTLIFALTVFQLMQLGERAVPLGQKEAAYSLGYNDLDTFIRIILPQAAQHILPPYQREVVSFVKATAVVGYISVMDITKIGDIVRGRTYDAVFPLLAVVVSYFILCAIAKVAVKYLIKKVDTKTRKQSEIMKGVEIR